MALPVAVADPRSAQSSENMVPDQPVQLSNVHAAAQLQLDATKAAELQVELRVKVEGACGLHREGVGPGIVLEDPQMRGGMSDRVRQKC